MIHFFRRIRQKLLSQGRLSKYLIYALGEIALVMIGILLALQVNNWNEKKTTNNYELRLLKGLHNSIENELGDWEFILNNNYKGDTSYKKIVRFLDNELPYTNSLSGDFQRALSAWYHEMNATSFETVKGYGLNFIQNQETVDHLSNMYERWHKIYENIKDEERSFYFAVTAPYIFEIFKRKMTDNQYSYVPINYQQLYDDQKFRSILEQHEIYRRKIIRWQEDILEDMHESLSLLETEMKRY